MPHWYLVLMGQAERVLMEWTRRRIGVLEEVLPPVRLDQVNEVERARTEGTGGIPPPSGKYERQLFWARRTLDDLENGGELWKWLRPTDEWAQHHWHDLTILQVPPEQRHVSERWNRLRRVDGISLSFKGVVAPPKGANIVLFCRTCDGWVGSVWGADDSHFGTRYAIHLGHDIRIRRDECPEEPDLVFYWGSGRTYSFDRSGLPWSVEHFPDGSTLPTLKPGTIRFPIPGLDVGIDCHTCGNHEGGPTPLFSGRVSEWFDELWNN